MARPDSYTQEQIAWLKENYAKAEWDDILEHIPGRTKSQIASKAHKLGVMRIEMNATWFTEREDRMIREHYRDTPIDEFIRLYCPNRTKSSIVTRAYKLKVSKRGNWTEEEDRIIRQNYYTLPMSELSKLIPDRAKSAIHCRIKQLGLSGAPMYKYSEADIEFVRENYLKMSDSELGEILHRKPQSIKGMRRKNKIYRHDPEEATKYKTVARYINRHNAEWKKESAKNCDYKCVISGEPFSDIHHLYSQNLILKEALDKIGMILPEDINAVSQEDKDKILRAFYEEQSKHPLGVCLQEKYHMMFHRIYGFGNNTPEQFEEFRRSVVPAYLSKKVR